MSNEVEMVRVEIISGRGTISFEVPRGTTIANLRLNGQLSERSAVFSGAERLEDEDKVEKDTTLAETPESIKGG